MRLSSALASLTLCLLTPFASFAQLSSTGLRHLQGTDPASGTEYTRILLPGSLISGPGLTPIAFTGTPTLIAQCTRQASGKQAFDLFLSFGDAGDLDFHALEPFTPAHPRPQRVEVTLDFSGYTHIKLGKRQFESLREPNGMLRYATPGFHSANMEDASILLRYLVALPELHLTEADRSAAFDTSPLLTDIRSEPLCKAALL